MRTDGDDDSLRGGFALITVLIFMLIVAAIVTPFALSARTNLTITNNEFAQEQLALLADGLTNVVSAELAQGLLPQALPTDFAAVGCRVRDLTIEVRVQDHNGLIDLNAADSRLLAVGFVAAGTDPRTAEELSVDVAQYRARPAAFDLAEDSATSIHLLGKFAPFESVAELGEFDAAAQLSLARVQTIFTVNSRRSTVSLSKASKSLKGFLASLVTGNEFILREAPEPMAYTVDVSVTRKFSDIVGRAGYVVEKDASRSLFHRAARYPRDESGIVPEGGLSNLLNCEHLFGPDVTAVLENLGSP